MSSWPVQGQLCAGWYPTHGPEGNQKKLKAGRATTHLDVVSARLFPLLERRNGHTLTPASPTTDLLFSPCAGTTVSTSVISKLSSATSNLCRSPNVGRRAVVRWLRRIHNEELTHRFLAVCPGVRLPELHERFRYYGSWFHNNKTPVNRNLTFNVGLRYDRYLPALPETRQSERRAVR